MPEKTSQPSHPPPTPSHREFVMGENFKIHVKTGDKRGAGTHAQVYMKLKDEHGNVSDTINLNVPWFPRLKKGSEDTFKVSATHVTGDIVGIQLWRNKFGFKPDWNVERVVVEQKDTPHRSFTFPVHRWIREDMHYTLRQYDASLPQHDPQLEQRQAELRAKREMYQYVINEPGAPVQIKDFPEDENYSEEYKWDLETKKAKLLVKSKIVNITTDSWKSIDDIKLLYKFGLAVPRALMHDWRSDKWFGVQRLCGPNLQMIQMCRNIPEKMQVTESDLKPHIDGHQLQDVIDRNRLFYTDHRLAHKLHAKTNGHVCAPLALFYLNDDDDLLPIAIQLEQDPGDSNPVFYPTDDPLTWLSVKMWYNNADGAYYEAIPHLGTTHLLMESVIICIHRHLSPSHPIFKLLAPHLMVTIALNTRGLETLFSPGGFVDSYTNSGRGGFFEMLARGAEAWSIDHTATVTQELADRGLFDLKVLPKDYWMTPIALSDLLAKIQKSNPIPGYYYRDDALLLFEAIKTYVVRIISHYYKSEEEIANDTELQSWAQELSASKETRDSKGEISGCGINGVPGGGKMESYPHLVQTLTAIIFTCTGSHAVSYQQYDEYAFPPNSPLLLHGLPPRDKKVVVTEQDILDQLPNKSMTLNTMLFAKILSEGLTNSLGDFEVQYLYDPESTRAAEEFRNQLHEISTVIRKRNEKVAHPYKWLDPHVVLNSISI